MRGAAVCLALLLFAPALRAEVIEQRQGNAVARFEAGSVEAGKAKVRLSDEIVLAVSVEGEYPLRFEKSDDDLVQEQRKAFLSGGAWYRCEGETQRTRTGDREQWRQTFHLDPLKPGEWKLSLLPLAYTEGPAKQARAVTWEPIIVTVATDIPQPDLKELRGPTGPEEVPPVRRWWLPWVVGLGVLLVGVGLILGGWGLKRQLAVVAPPPLPHQWALTELKRIEQPAMPARRFHTLVSDVLRRYFELRFELPATKQTTAEFLRTVHTLTPAQQDRLREFLERCDLAKFAPVETAAEECQVTATLARQLVEATAVLPETPGPEGSR